MLLLYVMTIYTYIHTYCTSLDVRRQLLLEKRGTQKWIHLQYVCMVITYSKSKDQPGKVANPARGQLNRGNVFFPCSRSRLRIWSRETGSAVPSRVSLLISILRPNLMLTSGILPISAAASIYFLNRHTPSGQSRVYRVT